MTKLFLPILLFAVVSCQPERSSKPTKADSLQTRIEMLEFAVSGIIARQDSLDALYNSDYASTSSDLDTLYKMAYRGKHEAEDLGKWQRRGQRTRAFIRGVVGR